MAGRYSQYDSRARCPFWKEADARSRVIRCEGPFDGSSIRTGFTRRADMDRQIRERCGGDYETCPLFRIALEKYEGKAGSEPQKR